MTQTLRYLLDTDEAIDLQPEPLSSITTDKLVVACFMAEDAVDKYLGTKGITTPIVIAGLIETQQDLLKRCVALMAAAVLFSQHNVTGAATKWTKDAENLLDAFISQADLGHSAVQSSLGIANYQEEYITTWNDPNSTAENMDV